MEKIKKILLIGPGASLDTLDPNLLKTTSSLYFGSSFKWFEKNKVYPTYYTFIDPNTVTYSDSLKNPNLSKTTTLIFHEFQGTDIFYNYGFTTSRGKDWNREIFGKSILPLFSSIFKETIKLPQEISLNSYKPLYSTSPTPNFPIIIPENKIYMDKFICFVLPTVLAYFKELKHIECVGFGDFNEPRLYNGSSLGYEAYKISYSLFKDKLIDLLRFKKIDIKFKNKDSYFIELEKNNKNE